MELLLILSAMLSAVTGAFTGQRAELRPVHAAAVQAEAPRPEQAEQVVQARRPAPAVAPIAAEPVADALQRPASTPLYGDRLIE